MDEEKRFRPNVAAVVVNEEGYILSCHRSDMTGVWQLPQGGVEEAETIECALYRELLEEIGTKEVSVIGKLDLPIRYEWPEHLRHHNCHGQEQFYFLVRLLPEASIDLSAAGEKSEFDRYQWVGAAEFLSGVRGFKVDAYKMALGQLMELHPGIIVP